MRWCSSIWAGASTSPRRKALTYLASHQPADKSFAAYYNEVSYGKYQVTGTVIGPYPFSMTTCDTTGMYKAIEPMITGTYNHLIYYFNETSLCDFGGLGEEGSALKPAKRTWMNGSLSCVVLMQEPGHNLGLMHANTMKCGTDSFSTTPATSCTITEYGSSMSTMGGGCKQFNAYERWYMQLAHRLQRRQDSGQRHLQPAAAREQLHGRQRHPGAAGPLPGDADGQRSAVDDDRRQPQQLLRRAAHARAASSTPTRPPARPDLGRRLHRPDGLRLHQRQRQGARRPPPAAAAPPDNQRTASGPSCST